MSRPLQRLGRFLRELKRRRVYRVGATYAAVAFVVWQAASFLLPAFNFPPWSVCTTGRGSGSWPDGRESPS